MCEFGDSSEVVLEVMDDNLSLSLSKLRDRGGSFEKVEEEVSTSGCRRNHLEPVGFSVVFWLDC